jgi:calcium binding protein 39
MQLFGKKSKTPQEIVRAIKESLPKLGTNVSSPAGAYNGSKSGTDSSSADRKSQEKLHEEISKHLLAMKHILYGDKRKKEPREESF